MTGDKYKVFIENDLKMMDGFTSLTLLAQMYSSKEKKIKELIKTAQKQIRNGRK